MGKLHLAAALLILCAGGAMVYCTWRDLHATEGGAAFFLGVTLALVTGVLAVAVGTIGGTETAAPSGRSKRR